MRVFAEAPECAVTSRLMLTSTAAVGAPVCPDYSILQDPANHEMVQRAKGDGKRILIRKEELGNNTKKGECSYHVLPSPSEYAALTQQPRREIKRVCSRWGIPFSDNMLEFSAPFGTSFVYKNLAEKDTYCHRQPPGLFSTVRASSTIEENVPSHGLVTNDEKDIIEHNLGELYLACWRDHVLQLSHNLAKKPWIGFDLDDTLHEFRRASSNASNKVRESMQERYAVPFAALKSQYSEILQSSTSNAFSDGKSSSEYKRDCFLAVAKHFNLPLKPDDPFLSQLLRLYETALKESLELKSGVLSLLKVIKRLGKQIVVIAEGPQDAQEWTVENLGLTTYVGFLATTNHFKVSKTNGLFSKVLETLEITPSEIAYVGDSEQRDIVPATAEGMFCFHFAEGKNCNLEASPPRINTLNKLEYILSSHENSVLSPIIK
ncbi:Haloacid dehalogenase-like hydrolase [Xylaria sp. FL0043]|nr:Haloacid dehalogenase-like hydrolase [Xylaria sp. FL0043]